MNPLNRRSFLGLSAAAVAATAANSILLEPTSLFAQEAPASPIRYALIGAGVRGCQLLMASQQVPGVECVAVSDLYTGRLQAAQEYAKTPIQQTRNYKELLARKDIDAVIVATMDHQHARVVADACAAGKDVYCEKPMSHTVDDGYKMIAAAQKHNRILQIGSQRVSNILFAKAREIYASGVLGEVFSIEAYTDRNSPSGAWQYPVPPDASPQTIDWNEFLVGAPARPFDPIRFFRWRAYRDYGEGLPGDLFVHLLTGIHFVTGINAAPERAYSTGGIFRYKDGRDQPDFLETLYDYPNLRVLIRCNGHSNAGESTTFYGTKGTLDIRGTNQLTFTPYDTTVGPEGYSTIGWPANLRAQYLADWHAQHPASTPTAPAVLKDDTQSYRVPAHYDDVVDHEAHFFQSVRTRTPPVENEIFGNHTAIACHMANHSYFNQSIAIWNEKDRKIT